MKQSEEGVCSLENLAISSNAANIQPTDMGGDNGYELGF